MDCRLVDGAAGVVADEGPELESGFRVFSRHLTDRADF
jgi:hypothetical protein